jgi:hypothetical protein
VDVIRWRESARAWAAAAVREAHTPELAAAASQVAANIAAVPIGVPGTMVATYVALAGTASCIVQAAVQSRPRPEPPRPPPPPVEPPEPPDAPWQWPTLPDFPGLPGLPGFPNLDAGLLWIALLIFAGGFILGSEDDRK